MNSPIYAIEAPGKGSREDAERIKKIVRDALGHDHGRILVLPEGMKFSVHVDPATGNIPSKDD
ncbi:hypothetical protein [Ponticaulis profundi]